MPTEHSPMPQSLSHSGDAAVALLLELRRAGRCATGMNRLAHSCALGRPRIKDVAS
jgi:hypothetical protein